MNVLKLARMISLKKSFFVLSLAVLFFEPLNALAEGGTRPFIDENIALEQVNKAVPRGGWRKTIPLIPAFIENNVNEALAQAVREYNKVALIASQYSMKNKQQYEEKKAELAKARQTLNEALGGFLRYRSSAEELFIKILIENTGNREFADLISSYNFHTHGDTAWNRGFIPRDRKNINDFLKGYGYNDLVVEEGKTPSSGRDDVIIADLTARAEMARRYLSVFNKMSNPNEADITRAHLARAYLDHQNLERPPVLSVQGSPRSPVTVIRRELPALKMFERTVADSRANIAIDRFNSRVKRVNALEADRANIEQTIENRKAQGQTVGESLTQDLEEIKTALNLERFYLEQDRRNANQALATAGWTHPINTLDSIRAERDFPEVGTHTMSERDSGSSTSAFAGAGSTGSASNSPAPPNPGSVGVLAPTLQEQLNTLLGGFQSLNARFNVVESMLNGETNNQAGGTNNPDSTSTNFDQSPTQALMDSSSPQAGGASSSTITGDTASGQSESSANNGEGSAQGSVGVLAPTLQEQLNTLLGGFQSLNARFNVVESMLNSETNPIGTTSTTAEGGTSSSTTTENTETATVSASEAELSNRNLETQKAFKIHEDAVIVHSEVVNKLEVELQAYEKDRQNWIAKGLEIPADLSQKIQATKKTLNEYRNHLAEAIWKRAEKAILTFSNRVANSELAIKEIEEKIKSLQAKGQAVPNSLSQQLQAEKANLEKNKQGLAKAQQRRTDIKLAWDQLKAGKNFHDLPLLAGAYKAQLIGNRLDPTKGLYQLIKAKQAIIFTGKISPDHELWAKRFIQDMEKHPQAYPFAGIYLNSQKHLDLWLYLGSESDSESCRSNKAVEEQAQWVWTHTNSLNHNQAGQRHYKLKISEYKSTANIKALDRYSKYLEESKAQEVETRAKLAEHKEKLTVARKAAGCAVVKADTMICKLGDKYTAMGEKGCSLTPYAFRGEDSPDSVASTVDDSRRPIPATAQSSQNNPPQAEDSEACRTNNNVIQWSNMVKLSKSSVQNLETTKSWLEKTILRKRRFSEPVARLEQQLQDLVPDLNNQKATLAQQEQKLRRARIAAGCSLIAQEEDNPESLVRTTASTEDNSDSSQALTGNK